MKKYILLTILCSQLEAQVVSNHSFEREDVSASDMAPTGVGTAWAIGASSPLFPTDWATNDNADSDGILHINNISPSYGNTPFDSQYAVPFDSTPGVMGSGTSSNAFLIGNISGLIVGQEYAVTFHYAGASTPLAGTVGAFVLDSTTSWLGTISGLTAPTQTAQAFDTWTSSTFNFTATEVTANIALHNSEAGWPLSKEGTLDRPFTSLVAFDNVTIAAVPEPSSILFASLAGLFFLRRKR